MAEDDPVPPLQVRLDADLFSLVSNPPRPSAKRDQLGVGVGDSFRHFYAIGHWTLWTAGVCEKCKDNYDYALVRRTFFPGLGAIATPVAAGR